MENICKESARNLVEMWRSDISALASEEKARHLRRFFKTGKGEYGEGDIFVGLTVPQVREISKKYVSADFDAIHEMLMSDFHEYRLCALFVLIKQFSSTRRSPERQKSILDFYLQHAERANNWDLVDLSAPKILGEWMVDSPEPELLDKLASSSSLWLQRISIVSTLTLIRNGRFEDTLRLAKHFLNHRHDLMHKATGWMLREIGKRDIDTLRAFLDEFTPRMPRTALRYAIERMDTEERNYYMHL